MVVVVVVLAEGERKALRIARERRPEETFLWKRGLTLWLRAT